MKDSITKEITKCYLVVNKELRIVTKCNKASRILKSVYTVDNSA